MATVLYDADADLARLRGRRIAVIGYGAQGHAHAQNLRESGCDIVVGARPGSAGWERAAADGMAPVAPAEAAEGGDVIGIFVPDHVQPALWRDVVAPALRPGAAVLFAHGFNIHFGTIEPPADVDVIMVAPKGPGDLVRRLFTRGAGVPSLIAVHQNASGEARELALAWGSGIGSGRAGMIETTFAEETETDLFGEQAVLCGGTTALVEAGFETLVKAGYQPEIAYFECLHELKLIVDLMYERGISGMREVISDTAEYGDLTRGPRMIDDHVRATMATLLDEIRSGEFARELIVENEAGRPVMRRLRAQGAEHPIEQVGARLRGMMPFVGEPGARTAAEQRG
jgi:ketol-acid reductoisomerase